MSTAEQETLSIDGMSCEHCVKLVREALDDLDGVTVENVEIGTATVSYDRGAVSRDAFATALDDAGFTLN